MEHMNCRQRRSISGNESPKPKEVFEDAFRPPSVAPACHSLPPQMESAARRNPQARVNLSKARGFIGSLESEKVLFPLEFSEKAVQSYVHQKPSCFGSPKPLA